MRQILLRTPKSPFDVIALDAVLDEKLIANNTGNLVFMHAAYRLLATPGTEITPDRLHTRAADADLINEQFDVYVLPFANAFRPQFEAKLVRYTALLEQLRIPVVVLGVGAQSTLDYDLERLRPLDRNVRRFVRAVLDRGPTIGVRGEFTEQYLRHLGFRDVEVIGCPSVFLNGPHVRVDKPDRRLDEESNLAFNAAPSQVTMGPLLDHLYQRYRNLVYVAQDPATLELLSLGRLDAASLPPPGFPRDLTHPLIRDGRVRVFPEPWPWIEFLRGVDFAFGSRAHGNLVSVIAGTPCYMLAHDSRTLELARYFQIPYRFLDGATDDLDPADLYDAADYGPLNAGHAARWATFEGYLRRHGLPSVFDAGGVEAFDLRVSELRFPVPGDAGEPGATLGAAGRLRHRIRRLRNDARGLWRRWSARGAVAPDADPG